MGKTIPCANWGHAPFQGRCSNCKIPIERILRATRLYANGNTQTSYWMPDEIEKWLAFNKSWRPECTLIVQGEIKHMSELVAYEKVALEITYHEKNLPPHEGNWKYM